MGEVLYDMRTPGSGLLSFPMPLILLAVGGVMIFGLMRKYRWTEKAQPFGKGGYVLMLVFIGLVFGAALLPQAFRPWAAHAETKASVLQGCVTNFQREVHPNGHNIADTYFTVQGVEFHFNSSPWLVGFHDEDDVIKPGDGLRIIRLNNTVLRIARAATIASVTRTRPSVCSPPLANVDMLPSAPCRMSGRSACRRSSPTATSAQPGEARAMDQHDR